MKRPSAPFVLPALLIAMLVIATTTILFAQNTGQRFTPPDVATAADINYPIPSVASGIVAIAVSLDGAGMIQGTDVLRDIPSLTAPVLLSIEHWTFKPATLDGKAVDSTIVVSIAFNPGDYQLTGTAAPILGKELKTLSADTNGFLPPQVISASWAVYPINSVAQGAVVLDVRVNRAGHVTRVAPVWSAPPLTKTSVKAARSWTFHPATFNRTPIASNAVVGYVFRPPNISSPVARP